MPDPLLVLPDPILVLIQYLRARPEITALVPAASIVTALPTNPVGQYVLLTWAGGQGIWPAVDDAAIQIDTMYGDKAACSLLMRTVRAAVWAEIFLLQKEKGHDPYPYIDYGSDP